MSLELASLPAPEIGGNWLASRKKVNQVTQLALENAAKDIENQYAPEKARLANENQANINRYYGPNIESEMNYRIANTNKVNKLLPYEVEEKRIGNKYKPLEVAIKAQQALSTMNRSGYLSGYLRSFAALPADEKLVYLSDPDNKARHMQMMREFQDAIKNQDSNIITPELLQSLGFGNKNAKPINQQMPMPMQNASQMNPQQPNPNAINQPMPMQNQNANPMNMGPQNPNQNPINNMPAPNQSSPPNGLLANPNLPISSYPQYMGANQNPQQEMSPSANASQEPTAPVNPVQEPSTAEKVADYKRIIEQGKAEGTANGKIIADIGKDQLSLSNSNDALNRIIAISHNPDFENLRKEIPFFQEKQLSYLSKNGTPAQKKIIGDYISTLQAYKKATVNSFKGKTLEKEFGLADKLKPDENDTVEVVEGKLRSLKTLHDIAETKNDIILDLMTGPKHMGLGKAVKEANKMIDYKAIEKEVDNLVSQSFMVVVSKPGGGTIKLPKSGANQLIKDHPGHKIIG